MVTMAAALKEMKADPEAFLRHYLVMIAGGAAAKNGTPSGIATFGYSFAGDGSHEGVGGITGFTTGRSGQKGIKKRRNKIQLSKIKMPPPPNLGANQFNAWYVAMALSGSGVQTTHTMVPGRGGPDIMLTSQLSGCTFGAGSATPTGDRLVSHILPLTTANARPTMQAEMLAGLNAGGVAGVFERENQPGAQGYGSDENRATVIGVRRKHKWHFYAQTYSRAQGANEIYSVQRID
jgi:hypothetical protein